MFSKYGAENSSDDGNISQTSKIDITKIKHMYQIKCSDELTKHIKQSKKCFLRVANKEFFLIVDESEYKAIKFKCQKKLKVVKSIGVGVEMQHELIGETNKVLIIEE